MAAVFDEAGETGMGGGEDGQALAEGLQRDQGEALVERGQHQEVVAAHFIEENRVRQLAEQLAAGVGRTQGLGERAGGAACKGQGDTIPERFESVEEIGEALRLGERAGEEEAEGRLCRRRWEWGVVSGEW